MNDEQLPTTRKDALSLGSKFYLSPDTPCKEHGIQKRYATNRKCVECSRAAGRRRTKSANPERYAEEKERASELAALREEHGAKEEFDFVEPLTISERALMTTVFFQLLQFQVSAALGRDFVEIQERHRERNHSTIYQQADRPKQQQQ
jgi:hypothetical protein